MYTHIHRHTKTYLTDEYMQVVNLKAKCVHIDLDAMDSCRAKYLRIKVQSHRLMHVYIDLDTAPP